MPDSTFRQLHHLFGTLVGLTPAERLAELDARDDLSESTRHAVLELLRLDAEFAGSVTASALATSRRMPGSWSGHRVGAYAIEAKLGEGGMGSVYRARRVAGGIEQQVAIKIAHRDLLDESTLARFRLERQVLAVLQHPNIAAMFDLGELDDGTPYIVMEHIEGLPLLDYVARNGLGLRERLALFLQLCDAVAYAHRNLIVHRDIKPSNVLVTEEGQPKLLDFGIAKPLQQRLGSIDIELTHAAHRYFSLRNAAPEQLRGDAVTVTCDVYGLGTLLYELVSGRPLYELDGLSLTQIERRITQDDPPPPSRRASDASGATQPWQRSLPSDLDAIVLLALRRDPQTRYASVDALAADIRRYLDGFAVTARHGSALYRLGRFARRHRVALATTALFLAVIAVGAGVWLRQYFSTLAERDRAESVTRTIVEALENIAPANVRERDITARELFEQVGDMALSPALDGQPATRMQLATTAARLLLKLGLPDRALSQLDRVAGYRTAVPQILRFEWAIVRTDVLLALGEAERAADVIRENAGAAESAAQRLQWQYLEALAVFYHDDYARALSLLQALAAPDSGASAQLRRDVRSEIVMALINLGREDEAYATELALLQEYRALHHGAHPQTLLMLQSALFTATALDKKDDVLALSAEALAMSSDVYGEDSYPSLIAIQKRAESLAIAGQLEQAEAQARKGLEKAVVSAHADKRLIAMFHFSLGEIQQMRHKPADALEHLRAAVRIGQPVMSDQSLTLAAFHVALATELLRQGDAAAAQTAVEPALAMMSRHPLLGGNTIHALALLVRELSTHRLRPGEGSRADVERLIVQAREAHPEFRFVQSREVLLGLAEAARETLPR